MRGGVAWHDLGLLKKGVVTGNPWSSKKMFNAITTIPSYFNV